MTKSILVPIELAHTNALENAVLEAGKLAKSRNASLTMIGVTGSAPSDAAHNPEEFEEKLSAYAQDISQRLGHPVKSKVLIDNDVSADLGKVLIREAEDSGVDLIVMASHVPGFIEHVFSSNAGYVASHAKCSVYIVR